MLIGNLQVSVACLLKLVKGMLALPACILSGLLLDLSWTRHFNSGQTMARITSEAAVEAIGNRFNLVLAASQRTRELKNGHRAKIETTSGPLITALKEIEQGKYTMKDYLDSIPRKRKGQRDADFT